MKLKATLLLTAALVIAWQFRPEPEQPLSPPTFSSRKARELNEVKPLPQVALVLADLSNSYHSGKSSSQLIRLQLKLDELWKDELPIDLLLEEIANMEKAPVYRLHLSHRLRNWAKISSPAEREDLANSFRQLLQNHEISFPAKLDLAATLVDFDHGEETVEVLSWLLVESAQDADYAHLISSLSRTNLPATKSTLWNFLKQHYRQPDTYPQSLAAALGALSQVNDFPLDSIAQHISQNTREPELLKVTLLYNSNK